MLRGLGVEVLWGYFGKRRGDEEMMRRESGREREIKEGNSQGNGELRAWKRAPLSKRKHRSHREKKEKQKFFFYPF